MKTENAGEKTTKNIVQIKLKKKIEKKKEKKKINQRIYV